MYYSISTGLSLSTLTILSTLTLTPVAEQDCCLLTWLVNSSNLLFRNLVISVSLSILSLKRSLYSVVVVRFPLTWVQSTVSVHIWNLEQIRSLSSCSFCNLMLLETDEMPCDYLSRQNCGYGCFLSSHSYHMIHLIRLLCSTERTTMTSTYSFFLLYMCIVHWILSCLLVREGVTSS